MYWLVLLIALFGCKTPAEKIAKSANDQIAISEFNGFVYIAYNGQSVVQKSLTNPKLSASPISFETPVQLASLTKLFVKVALLRLVDDGKLDLDQPISDILVKFRPSFGQNITPRHLMEMKSGLPRELLDNEEIGGVLYNENGFAGPFLDTIPNLELQSEPGEKYSYSNLDYWILGSVIEATTGLPIEEAMKALVFNELEMSHSGLVYSNEIAPGISFQNDVPHQEQINYSGRYTSGGFYASASDLVSLSEALQTPVFLSDHSLNTLFGEKDKLEIYGSLPTTSNIYFQDRANGITLILLNNVGLSELSQISDLKNEIEKAIGLERKAGPKRKVTLFPVEALSDSSRVESGLKKWARAVESGSESEIYSALKNVSVPGSMRESDPTWKELVKVRNQSPGFKALGYRWVDNEEPKGIEVWFAAPEIEGKLAIRWLLSTTDSTKVENIFVMPDDMEWLGKSF